MDPSTELNEEETKQLVGMFRSMGVKPKTTSPDELRQWMKDYVSSQDQGSTSSNHASPRPNTSTVNTVVTQNPRVSSFSGVVKNDQVSYEVWKYEVDTLVQEKVHSSEAIIVAVRKSLKGEPANIAMRLGVTASLDTLIKKLDGIYGTVEPSQSLLAQFYGAQQKSDEGVSAWACRLEDILDRACKQGQVVTGAMNEMLRTRFWTGLHPSISDAARHKFDTIKEFDAFVIAVRRIELELAQRSTSNSDPPKPRTQSKSAQPTGAPKTTELDELKGMIKSLATTVDSLKQQVSRGKTEQNQNPPGSRQKQYGNRTQGTGRGGNQQPNQQGNAQNRDAPPQRGCWRCGSLDHIKIGCRAKLNQPSLNSQRPAQQEEQE